MRQHFADVVHHREHQLIFQRREVHFFLAYEYAASAQIDLQTIALVDHGITCVYRQSMPQRRNAHSGQQLASAKRLGQIVVCPAIQCRNLLRIMIAHRKDDDWRRQPFASRPSTS